MAVHVSICDAPSCRIAVEGRLDRCPNCGGAVRHVRQAQPRAWVLIIIGAILLLMMSAVAYYMVPLMLRPGEEVGGASFDGNALEAATISAFFALLIAFGLTVMLGGVHELRTGRQHHAFLRFALTMFAAIMIGATILQIVIR